MPNKVTVEITPNGYTVTASVDGAEVIERWERKPFGSSQTSDSGSFERAEDIIGEDLCMALSDLKSGADDVMDNL